MVNYRIIYVKFKKIIIMGNCLITKLKGNVDNDSLPKFGKIEVPISVNNSNEFVHLLRLSDTMAKKEFECEIIGEGNFIGGSFPNGENLGKSVTLSSSLQQVYVSNGEFKLIIGNIYNINKITGVLYRFADFNMFKYSDIYSISNEFTTAKPGIGGKIIAWQNLTFVYTSDADKITGNVSELANCPLNALMITGTGITSNVSDLSQLTTLTNLQVTSTGGELSDLGTLTNLSQLTVMGHLSGSVESFVQALRTNGKTSGSIKTNGRLGDDITFDGEHISNDYVANETLVWTATQITYKNKTINA